MSYPNNPKCPKCDSSMRVLFKYPKGSGGRCLECTNTKCNNVTCDADYEKDRRINKQVRVELFENIARLGLSDYDFAEDAMMSINHFF